MKRDIAVEIKRCRGINVKKWRRTPSFPRFEAYIIPWSIIQTVRGVSSATLGHNWFGTGKKNDSVRISIHLELRRWRSDVCCREVVRRIFGGQLSHEVTRYGNSSRSRGCCSPGPTLHLSMKALNLHGHPIGSRANVCFPVVSSFPPAQSTMDTDSRQRYHGVSDMYGITAYILAFWPSKHILSIIGWRSH